MSLWKIAWRSIRQRGLASILTALSMSLGVLLVVCVLSILGVVQQSFKTNASLGYNMIVGAKGGSVQLTLNTVYYLSQPIENIPYEYYLEFFPQERRDAEMKNSLRAAAQGEREALLELQNLASLGSSGLAAGVTDLATRQALHRAERRQLDFHRDGQFAQYTKLVIPVCLGDYYGPFRVVATRPEMFERLKFGERGERSYRFAQGRNFREYDSENQYFEAVVGHTVAEEMNLKAGESSISPSHGASEDAMEHSQKFKIVGVLERTNTPNDRAVFINMEGFFLMEDHAKPVKKEKADEPDASADGTAAGSTGGGAAGTAEERMLAERAARAAAAHEQEHGLATRLPVEQREATALLVLTSSFTVTPGLTNVINEGPVAQAALPVKEIFSLFELFVRPIQMVLLILTAMICVVSGVSILVSIYNSMSDRRHEIAVMRALGASRGVVMSIVLLESIMLSLGGGLVGWVGGHLLNAAASGRIERLTGVSIGVLDMAPPVNLLELLGVQSAIRIGISTELLIIPGLILLAIVVGFLPALAAYRTDVARSLGS